MTITEYLKYAELAQAVYADLFSGSIGFTGQENLQADANMSLIQAQTFASTYSVIDQYNDPSSGLSVTLFEDASGHQTVAIRGTNDLLDFLRLFAVSSGLRKFELAGNQIRHGNQIVRIPVASRFGLGCLDETIDPFQEAVGQA